MAILYLLMFLIYFVCIGLDVVMFFLQVRLVLAWREIKWLKPFDLSGRPITDAIVKRLPTILKLNKPLSEKGILVIAMLIVAITRILLGFISNLR